MLPEQKGRSSVKLPPKFISKIAILHGYIYTISEGGDALNRWPKEAVGTPFLEAFKARLDVALGTLVCWLATLHIAGGWNWMSTVVLFNPGHSMIL